MKTRCAAPAMTGDQQMINVGGIEVQAINAGRAHTGGDLLVYLPKQKILFMSEVYLNRVFPAMRSAYPTEWVSVIDKALADGRGPSSCLATALSKSRRPRAKSSSNTRRRCGT